MSLLREGGKTPGQGKDLTEVGKKRKGGKKSRESCFESLGERISPYPMEEPFIEAREHRRRMGKETRR